MLFPEDRAIPHRPEGRGLPRVSVKETAAFPPRRHANRLPAAREARRQGRRRRPRAASPQAPSRKAGAPPGAFGIGFPTGPTPQRCLCPGSPVRRPVRSRPASPGPPLPASKAAERTRPPVKILPKPPAWMALPDRQNLPYPPRPPGSHGCLAYPAMTAMAAGTGQQEDHRAGRHQSAKNASRLGRRRLPDHPVATARHSRESLRVPRPVPRHRPEGRPCRAASRGRAYHAGAGKPAARRGGFNMRPLPRPRLASRWKKTPAPRAPPPDVAASSRQGRMRLTGPERPRPGKASVP
jgi:hypothetical protein